MRHPICHGGCLRIRRRPRLGADSAEATSYFHGILPTGGAISGTYVESG